MTLLFVLKLLVVLFFLAMFLRGSRLVWGIGLLTVTTAFLLDTFLGTFGREEMIAQLGFFFYVISGVLFGGAALWLFGLLLPMVREEEADRLEHPRPVTVSQFVPQGDTADWGTPVQNPAGTTFDRQLVYEQIRDRLGPEDVLDLMFDLGINENEVMSPGQEMHETIVRMMDLAEERGQTGGLALAVERIITPLPPENLPRRDRLSADSPPTVLRQFLLAYYDITALRQMATQLGIDWEQLEYGNKKSFTRSLLLYLYRRNRIEELITVLHAPLEDEATA
jgi:hypothetical protein